MFKMFIILKTVISLKVIGVQMGREIGAGNKEKYE